jgi:hypothetical protein
LRCLSLTNRANRTRLSRNLMSTKTQSALDELRLAIHGVTAPFSCAGTVTPKSPVTFVFRDGFRFAVNRAMNAFAQKAELEPLLKRCRPASFGDGKKTRYDPTVRDALQLNAEGASGARRFRPLCLTPQPGCARLIWPSTPRAKPSGSATPRAG